MNRIIVKKAKELNKEELEARKKEIKTFVKEIYENHKDLMDSLAKGPNDSGIIEPNFNNRTIK